ncbi:MAG: hypothetical protein P8N52_02760, partial [Crocinitomicaceae bacterium]|nr:hypothetical protein [Crocinitomicaceae bacterium]
MKKFLIIILTFYTSGILACSGDYFDGWSFYNLFKQTNISAEEFYPFLREDDSQFYTKSFYNNNKLKTYPKGNIYLWKELLVGWNINEIEK